VTTDPAEPTDGGGEPRVGPGERGGGSTPLRELAVFLPDVAKLLWRIVRDPRVSRRAKAIAAGAVVYVASPIDLVPDQIPVLGQLDDVWVVTRALRYLVTSTGYDLVRELWPGSDDGFALLLVVAGIDR
jgi:uncharacterized membrane protein YkvA (DUF1232 family)